MIADPHANTPPSTSRMWIAARWALGAAVLVGFAVVLVLTSVRSSPVVPDQLPWLHDPTEAGAIAERDHKPMMLFFTADWCGPCQRFKRDVLYTDPVRAAIAQSVVPVKVDLTNPDMTVRSFAQRYEVQGIPDLLLTDARGRVIARFDRSLDADGFARWITAAASQTRAAF